MRLLADLHLHSRYTKATSRDMDLENMVYWARCKGIHILGTGDFTHPMWFQELREKLRPAEEGLFRLREDLESPILNQSPATTRAHEVRFLLSAEIAQNVVHQGQPQRIRHLLFAPDLETAERINQSLSAFGDLQAEGRPSLQIETSTLLDCIKEASPRAYLVPAHVVASWFSLLGHRSAFHTVEAFFGAQSKEIFALESGLMIDTPQLRRISKLDRYTLLASSNAHSPNKIGRAAIELDVERSYDGVFSALQSPSPQNFLGTIETWPEEEKYYLDGHQRCRISMTPAESRHKDGICPACKKPLTHGVMSRIEQLADRKQPPKTPHIKLLSLEQILSELLQCNTRAKRLQKRYTAIIDKLGHEIDILREVPLESFRSIDVPLLDEAMRRVRQGELICEPGYDGQPGKIRIFQPDEQAIPQQDLFPGLDFSPPSSNQLMLFDMASPAFWRRRIPTTTPQPAQEKQFDLFTPVAAEPEPPYIKQTTTPSPQRPSFEAIQHIPEEPSSPVPPLRQMDITEAIAYAIAAKAASTTSSHATLGTHAQEETHRVPVFTPSQALQVLQNDQLPILVAHDKDAIDTTPKPSDDPFLQEENAQLAAPPSFSTLLSGLPNQKLSPPPFSPEATLYKLRKLKQRISDLQQDPRALRLLRVPTPPVQPTANVASLPTSTSSTGWQTLSALPKKLLSRLNIEQRSAVKHWGSPLQIVAGPGTGKTYTLLYRILYLIATRQLDSSQILTFVHSEQAVRRLSERVQKHLSPRHNLTITTFHRFCLELLAGEECLPRLLSDVERISLLVRLARQQDAPLHDHEIPLLLHAISTAKQMHLSPAESGDTLPEMNERFQEIFASYQATLQERGLLDLDDLLLEGLRLLSKDGPLRQQLRLRFRSIHVDDYQDITPAQHQLLRYLVSNETDLCVVGDPDQAIATTEGADLHHFYQFKTDFSTPQHAAQRYTLWRNYRSPRLLLDAAHALISTQPDPQRTQMEALQYGAQQQIPLLVFEDPEDEARGIAQKIQDLLSPPQEQHEHGESLPLHPHEIAICYHHHSQIEPLRKALEEAGLPYWMHAHDDSNSRKERYALLAWLRFLLSPQQGWEHLETLLFQRPDWRENWTNPLLQLLKKTCNHPLEALSPQVLRALESALSTLFPPLSIPLIIQSLQRIAQMHLRLSLPGLLEQPIALLDLIFAEIDQHPIPHSPQLRSAQRSALYERARFARNAQALFAGLVLEQHTPLFPQAPHLVKLLPFTSLKGLQFPVLFLSGCDDLSLPPEEMHPYPERVDEALRLFYTAIHRTQKLLFLSYARATTNAQGEIIQRPASRFLEALVPYQQVQPLGQLQRNVENKESQEKV
ncbi:MAG: UvrD-helicase domain-containing protein [Myxococcales bacterium]|nr:UvrD-helicase domain-containing protein [Myxococcales bacterium]